MAAMTGKYVSLAAPCAFGRCLFHLVCSGTLLNLERRYPGRRGYGSPIQVLAVLPTLTPL